MKKYLPYTFIAGILVVIGGLFLYGRTNNSISNPLSSQKADSNLDTSSVTFIPDAARGNGTYADGVYTAIGYYAPHGLQTALEVKVTLKDDVIVDVDSKLNSEDSYSKFVTEKFKSGYKPLVVGKSIKGLSLGAVSGSSLTPKGFNDALRKIEVFAQK